MQDIAGQISNFVDLNWMNMAYLFLVGFVGGLVSGFIGSGGAFVLTPGMMSLGVPGLVAVASNMCHKFPKALVGAIKRAKYGQVPSVPPSIMCRLSRLPSPSRKRTCWNGWR